MKGIISSEASDTDRIAVSGEWLFRKLYYLIAGLSRSCEVMDSNLVALSDFLCSLEQVVSSLFPISQAIKWE